MKYTKIAFYLIAVLAVASMAPSFAFALATQDNGTTAETSTPSTQDNGTTAGMGSGPALQDNGTTAGTISICTGSGLGISLFVNPSEVHIGDTISYSVLVFNGNDTGVGSVYCDVSDITASLVTPDGTNHPITLARAILLSEQSNYYPSVVTYIARTEDVAACSAGPCLKATASVIGVVHRNNGNIDSAGANQGVNVTLIIPTPITQDNGTTAGTFTPITQDNGTTAGTITPITQDNGTTAGTFTPITQDNGTTAGTISITGNNRGGGTHSPIIVPAVLGAAISPLVVIPKLPKTGFPPQEKSTTLPIVLLSGLSLVSIFLYFVQKKQTT